MKTKTITLDWNIGEKHTIEIRDGSVQVFNHYRGKSVDPKEFDKEIASRDFTGRVNAEEIFKAAARKRSTQSASIFIGNSLCWGQGNFELQGWN